jgi:hypothetical protein
MVFVRGFGALNVIVKHLDQDAFGHVYVLHDPAVNEHLDDLLLLLLH